MSAKILVVDDSLVVRQQVRKALAGAGYAVVEAVDGADAMDKFNASPDTALIVCDMNMPRVSGLEFLQSLRDAGGRRPPIIMLTTEGQPELIQRAKELGAKVWMVKPLKPEMLIMAAKKLIMAAA